MRLKRIRPINRPPHIISLQTNLDEINRLLEIHTEIAGSGPGYKHNVQVLNKSAVVLLLACWEAYIEDLAENCFNWLLTRAKEPHVFPVHVLNLAAKEVKKPENDLWQLANSGWKDVLKTHKVKVLEKYVVRNSFNTPNPDNIDRLVSNLLGMSPLSRTWYWAGMSVDKSKEKLIKLIELRGNIVHRVQTSHNVTKSDVSENKEFILRLAVISNNRAISFLEEKTKQKPWRTMRYMKTK